MEPKSAPDWYMTPIRRQSPSRVAGVHSSPATVKVPASTGLRPIMCLRMVDLPQPEPPSRMKISPGAMSKLTSARIVAPG